MLGQYKVVLVILGLLFVSLLGIWAINATDTEPVASREFSTADPIKYGIDAGRHVKVNVFDNRTISAEFETADIILGKGTRQAFNQIGVWNPHGETNAISNSFTFSNPVGIDIWTANELRPRSEATNISSVEYNYRTEVIFPASGMKAVKYHLLDWVLIVPLQNEKMSARIATTGDRYPAYYMSRFGEDIDLSDESRIIYLDAYLTGRADWIWVTG